MHTKYNHLGTYDYILGKGLQDKGDGGRISPLYFALLDLPRLIFFITAREILISHAHKDAAIVAGWLDSFFYGT